MLQSSGKIFCCYNIYSQTELVKKNFLLEDYLTSRQSGK